MTGLILKDFLILRKTFRIYLLFIVLYGGLALTGIWTPEAVGGVLMVLVAMLPLNVFSYDKQANWDTYGLALPVGRTKTVCARYVCVLLLTLIGVALEVVLGVVMSTLVRLDSLPSYLLTCAVCGLMAVLINAVMLPLLYRFGADHARIMLYVIFGFIVLFGWAFLVPGGGAQWLKALGEPSLAQISAIPAIAALAGLALLTLSFLLSRHFYGAKDV